MEIEEGSSKDSPIIVDPDRDIYVRSAYRLNYPEQDWQEEHVFLNGLPLDQSVMNLVSEFDNIEFDMSVHIRMQGANEEEQVSFDGPENWSDESHTEIIAWRQKSHYSGFLGRVRSLADLGEVKNVFVAADNQEAYNAFSTETDFNVHYLKRDCFDRSSEQIKFALADAILLSE